jgi:tetratricopeptide (TPR) repeat protein
MSNERIGDVLFAEGKLEEASKYYQSIVTQSNANPVAHERMGAVLIALGKKDEALREYRLELAITDRLASSVRLTSRNGHDLTYRFPQIVTAVASLQVRSCLIDGEAIICDSNGLAVFKLLRSYRNGQAATFCAFDVIEIDGEDLRRQPIEDRKLALKTLIGSRHPGIAFNRHFDIEGAILL